MSLKQSEKLLQELASNQTSSEEDPNSKTKLLIKQIEIIIFAFVILIGLVGNSLNLIVFGKKNMRKISTFKWFFYKSAIDILVLLFGATDIVVKKALEYHIRTNSNFLCKMHTFFTYFVTHTSSFILMAVSIDRVIIMMNSNSLNSHLGNSNAKRFRRPTYLTENTIESHRMIEIKEPLSNTQNNEPKKKATLTSTTTKKKRSIKINLNSNSKIVIERVSFNEIKEKFWKRKKEAAVNDDEDNDYENNQERLSVERRESAREIKPESYNKCTLASIFDRFSVNRVAILILILLILTNFHYILFLKLNVESDNNKLVIDDISEKLGTFRYSRKKNMSLYPLTRKMNNFFNLTAQNLINSNLLDTPTCYSQEDSYHEFFLQKIWIWIDLSVYSLIPFCTNLICSLLIIFKVRKLNRNYSQFLKNKDYEYNKKTYEKKIKKNNQICLMLLMVNLWFFISMLQFWIFFYFFKDTKDQIDDRVYLYVYIILYTNNAIDFIIYYKISEKYREEALSIFFFIKPNQHASVKA